MPTPTSVPVRNLIGSSPTRPEVRMVSSAAPMARWMKRSIERMSRLGTKRSASKPLHSPAIREV